MKFKAVIFDFGNVIINIDIPRTFQAFATLTGKRQAVIEKLVSENQLFRRYETGQFTDIEFREIVRQTVGFPLSDTEVDIPQRRIDLIKEIRRKYPIYLLSNTNNIHIEASNSYLKKAFGYRHLDELFDQLFLSYEIGMWKPDTEIYQYVLDEINLKPHEVLSNQQVP